jgi:hypothetical protein
MRHSGKLRIIDDAISSNAPTLGTFIRAKGREFTEQFVIGWLIYLNDILDLKKPMSADQIQLTAIEIINTYFYLKLSDFTLLYKRIISGVYGEFYESLSIAKVLTFFRDYNEERIVKCAENSERNHKDQKSNQEFNVSKNYKRILRGLNSK